MSSFCFIVTEECNWKCKYCGFPEIVQPKSTNLQILSRHLPYIKEIVDKLGDLLVFCDIAGGEVGLLPLDVLQYFFKTIDRKIVVSTNGLFMEKGYHLDPVIRPYIDGIWWHVHPEPKGKIDYDWNDDEIFINKGITHDNAQEMVDFCEANPNIQMNYVEFEFPIGESLQKNDSDYLYLLEKLEDLPNVTQNAKDILRSRLTEKEGLREQCRDFSQTVVFDLINENILLCHRSMNNYIPLNRKNLEKRLRLFPKDVFPGENQCNSCTRLYSGKMQGNIFETYFRVKRLFS